MAIRRKNLTTLALNLATVLGVLCCILFIVWGIRHHIFSSKEAMEQFLEPFGIWGPVIFIIIQIVQVIVPIIPGGVSCLAGVVLFGAGWGFLYNYIGIVIGSICAFAISRRYGSPLVQQMINPKTYERYSTWLNQGHRFDKCFALAIFFPVAPDDALCYLAGLTKMTMKRFTAIIVLCKPCSIFLYSLGLTGLMNLFSI